MLNAFLVLNNSILQADIPTHTHRFITEIMQISQIHITLTSTNQAIQNMVLIHLTPILHHTTIMITGMRTLTHIFMSIYQIMMRNRFILTLTLLIFHMTVRLGSIMPNTIFTHMDMEYLECTIQMK